MVALSELHSRLEHLVSYSSQLIFVSGETIGRQQSLLEAFLGQQSELCEIAYLTANSKFTITDYRRQFVRQLLGETEGILSRPLNELLAPLNQHEGPVIICVCQAENMPRQLLQEMWELVLQSRFAGNKQHLNVLLFGQPDWAEQAKAWIPANNRDKPLLLSNESVSSEFVLQDNTSVQALITHKRQLFEQRLKTRHQPVSGNVSLLKSWWMKALLLCVFLLIFCSILIWQYRDLSLLYWQNLSTYIFPPPATAIAPELDRPAAAEEEQVVVAEQIETQPQPPQINIAPVTEDVLLTTPGDNENPLVTDWQSAISRIEQKQEVAAEQPTPPAAGAEEPVASDAESTEPAPTKESIVATGAAPRLMDYAVDDIVSEDQLEPQQRPITPEVVKPLYHYDELALLNLNSNHFVVQLSAMSSESVLQEFIADNQLANSSWVYLTRRFGGNWYVVLHKQSYPSLESARQASMALPPVLLAGEPFVKAVTAVKQELDAE